ncbi:amidohydrolase family protein [Qipengyuania sphaerica]|uniref:amidohydrolase family protein n=1 Tax=Qipengyuania sphaerica TaxID=2867243 RepID=UPI001C86D941|nr:amidohydrolase family protein [Qipengyuania sphaerica]MBX7540184.1 amidohydrolase family protein [Qipengyuania sphaerica]
MRIHTLAIALSIGLAATASAQSPAYEGPVIDMHVHATTADSNGPPGMPLCPGVGDFAWDGQGSWAQHLGMNVLGRKCENPLAGSPTDEALRDETIAAMRAHNVRCLLSGQKDRVADWMSAGEGLFWPSRSLNLAIFPDQTVEVLEQGFEDGEFVAIAEITNQYDGILVDDPRMEPFWAFAEANGIPVGVHIGKGTPGGSKIFPEYTVQAPLQLSPVLKAHPDLRIYVMHAGYPFAEDIKAMLWIYPQLMVDIAVLQFGTPRAEYHAFLSELVRAGFSDRIMFGADQMTWPGAIKLGIDAVNEADYLTYEQKKDILHDNAARFLRLDAEGNLPD